MTLGDLVDRLCAEHNAHVRDAPGGSLSGKVARGEVALRFIVRDDENGRRWTFPVEPRMTPSTELEESVLRAICRQLAIDPADFGIAEPRN